MRLAVNGRNIDVTPALKSYVEDKIGKVINHYDQIMELVITLGVVKNPSVHDKHFAEATCFVNGTKIHLKEEAESMYASIDLLSNKLDRQVRKNKEKLLKNKSGSIRTTSPEIEEEEEAPSEE